ncbi:hypothetical protein GEA64_15570 [Photorhabdus khanii]|uniref:Uncharacterized protein n=1 Tax=Photorhabdus khanii TaxID=1004150 RepID=A0A7C9GKC7_9GAMM|nr:hypothetical protein [Photorhabdus khanii]
MSSNAGHFRVCQCQYRLRKTDLPSKQCFALEQGSPALRKKTDDYFNALLSRYYALQKEAGLTGLPEKDRP